jgi:hypothetical protein
MKNLISLEIYFLGFAFCLLFASLVRVNANTGLSSNQNVISPKFNEILIFFLIGFPLVFLAGTRIATGTDYFSYESMYFRYCYGNADVELRNTREPLFGLLLLAIGKISNNSPRAMHFFCSFLTVYLFELALFRVRKQIDIVYSVLIYYLYFYLASYNIQRQMLTVSIMLNALYFAKEKKFLKFLITVYLAGMIHVSAFLCLFFYVFNKIKFSRILMLLLLLITGVMTFFLSNIFAFISLIPIFFQYFVAYSFSNPTFGYGWIIDCIPVVLPLVMLRKYLVLYDKDNYFYMYVAFTIIPMRFAGYYTFFLFRMIYYPAIVSTIAIPIALKNIKEKRLKFMYALIVIVIYALYFLYYYYFENSNEVFPYYSIFSRRNI